MSEEVEEVEEDEDAFSEGVIADPLMQARCRLMVRNPWYGHMALRMEWIQSEMVWIPEERRSIGFRIMNDGIKIYYYKPWVMKKRLKELYGFVQEIIEHLVRLHPVRRGSREPNKWDVCCDMCVHGHKKDPQIGYKEDNKKVVLPAPEDDMIWLPKEIETGIGAEDLYDKIPDEEFQKHINVPNPGQGQEGEGQGEGEGEGDGDGEGEGQGEGQGQGEGDGQGEGGGGEPHVKTIDDHSMWGESEASEDTARQIVKEMADHAAQRCQGHVPGHLQEALKELEKAQVRWREILRMLTGTHIGNRRWTNSRRNRRTDKFGDKGVSRHAAAKVSVVVDTSGSISSKALQQFFAEIEMITTRADVCMLQWDHAFQGFTPKYRRNDWKEISINGRGGTDMAAPMQWLIQKQQVGDCCIMLTDGYCNWIEEQSFPHIICIIGKEGSVEPCPWGNTVWIDEHQ